MAKRYKKLKSGKLIKLNKSGIPKGATIYPDGSWSMDVIYDNGSKGKIGELICNAE